MFVLDLGNVVVQIILNFSRRCLVPLAGPILPLRIVGSRRFIFLSTIDGQDTVIQAVEMRLYQVYVAHPALLVDFGGGRLADG